jgi:hypothetical protein
LIVGEVHCGYILVMGETRSNLIHSWTLHVNFGIWNCPSCLIHFHISAWFLYHFIIIHFRFFLSFFLFRGHW